MLATDAWALPDLGRHRLKDINQPHRIYQLGDARQEPLRTISGAVGNLPAQRNEFVGRGSLIDGITDALGQSRLVTLTGAGGVGKTRMALEIAGHFAARWADGAWLCPLAEADGRGAVVNVINSALGHRPEPSEDPA